MNNPQEAAVLDRLLEPVSRCFTGEVARALLAVRVDELAQARVDELADKCDAGTLTPDERDEYDAHIQASTLIGILQAKARRALAAGTPA